MRVGMEVNTCIYLSHSQALGDTLQLQDLPPQDQLSAGRTGRDEEGGLPVVRWGFCF